MQLSIAAHQEGRAWAGALPWIGPGVTGPLRRTRRTQRDESPSSAAICTMVLLSDVATPSMRFLTGRKIGLWAAM